MGEIFVGILLGTLLSYSVASVIRLVVDSRKRNHNQAENASSEGGEGNA